MNSERAACPRTLGRCKTSAKRVRPVCSLPFLSLPFLPLHSSLPVFSPQIDQLFPILHSHPTFTFHQPSSHFPAFQLQFWLIVTEMNAGSASLCSVERRILTKSKLSTDSFVEKAYEETSGVHRLKVEIPRAKTQRGLWEKEQTLANRIAAASVQCWERWKDE